MRIGELAERVGVNPKTIRYYEEKGLLPDAERLPSGYREYCDDDVERLRFVKAARGLGLSLSEISEVLGFRERDERPCEYVLGVLDRQVADLDRRMAEMARLRRQLVDLKARAARLPTDGSCYCAVIEHAEPTSAAIADIGRGAGS
jgi:DNA-binding transcriptional MerR regulator